MSLVAVGEAPASSAHDFYWVNPAAVYLLLALALERKVWVVVASLQKHPL